MNKSFKLLCIILVVLIALFGFYLVGTGSQVLGSKTFSMYLTVGDKLGFNIDTNAVYFGETLPGSMAKRDLLISNNFNERVLVTVDKSGELSGWVSPSIKDFYLNAGEVKKITLFVTVPPEAKLADYSGAIMVYYIKANN